MKNHERLIMALLIALVFFLILLGCQDNPVEPERTLTGFITVVGNEPFTNLALSVDNDIYVLQCDKVIESELWKMQGTKVIVYYRTMTADPSGKIVDVIRYEVWR